MVDFSVEEEGGKNQDSYLFVSQYEGDAGGKQYQKMLQKSTDKFTEYVINPLLSRVTKYETHEATIGSKNNCIDSLSTLVLF